MSESTSSLDELCAPESRPGSGLWESCDCPTFVADPDIAGIGVVSSFLTSSGLALVGTCLYLALIRAYIGEQKNEQDDFNWIDRFVRAKIGTPIVELLYKVPWIESRNKKIRVSLFALVLSLADTQLVTGIAMLIAAVIKLRSNSISVYHFSMVTNLAWFSASVHLLALLPIRTELIGSHKKKERHLYQPSEGRSRWERIPAALGRSADVWVRVVSMLTLAALLGYCSYVSGADGWNDNYNCPASCSWTVPRGGEPRQWMLVNMVLLVRGHISSCLLLSQKAGRWWIDSTRHWFLDDQGLEQAKDQKLPLRRKILLFVYYILNSETIDVIMNGFLWFGIGVQSTFDDRKGMYDWWDNVPDESRKENDVEGFGQLVPLLLLGLPLLQVLQTHCGISRHEQTDDAQKAWAEALVALDTAAAELERAQPKHGQTNSDEALRKLTIAKQEREEVLKERRVVLDALRSASSR